MLVADALRNLEAECSRTLAVLARSRPTTSLSDHRHLPGYRQAAEQTPVRSRVADTEPLLDGGLFSRTLKRLAGWRFW